MRPTNRSIWSRVLRFSLGTSLLLCSASSLAIAESKDAIEKRLATSVKFLSSDELEGRGLGSKGLDQAADFIANEFSKLGLKTKVVDGGPFQSFTVTTKAEMGPKEENTLEFIGPATEGNGETQRVPVKLEKEFQTLAIGGSNELTVPLVFVGYGITAPEHEYDDYADVDVEGKAVVIIRKEPQQDNPHSVFDGKGSSQYALFSRKVSNAFQHGAAAVILVNDAAELARAKSAAESAWRQAVDRFIEIDQKYKELKEPTAEQTSEYRSNLSKQAERISNLAKRLDGDFDQLLGFTGAGMDSSHHKLPVFFCRRAVIESMIERAMGKKLAEIEEMIDEDLKPRSAVLDGWSVQCRSSVVHNKADVKNVIGVLEGEGALADETVVVGAHYDHLGFGGQGNSLAPGTIAIHNGADDNASGTAALIEVARRLASSQSARKRRIVFIAFTGEERGLLGSAHYVNNPVIPLEKTVAMVNMDMVGRLNENKLIVHGTGTAKEFDALVDETNQALAFKITKNPGGFGPSDHAAFYGKKIPVIHVFTGTHQDYHRPSDDFEKINVPGMSRVVEFVADLTERIDQMDKPPTYVAIQPKTVSRGGSRPYFGSIPDFGRQVEGYALMGVAPGSPAEKAGIQGGDVIIKFGDSKIGGLEDIDGALRKYKPGEGVKVTVKRGEKELTFTVILDPPR